MNTLIFKTVQMKKTISFIAILSMLSALTVPFFGTANADLTTKKVRVVVTYPVSDATLGVDAGALVHEPNSGVLFRFALKDSSGTNLCMEEKTVPVVNGIMTYELGSQYAINANGVSTGCNMASLISSFDYKVVVTGDLNRNNNFTDSIDYVSEEASWTEASSQQFEDSFLDSKTLDIQQNIGTGGGSQANIDYNINAGALNTQLIAAGQKTKTFDLDGDGATEVFAVEGGNGMIYSVNKVTGSYENVHTSTKITLDDASNIFISGRLGNFVLHGALGTDSSATVSNISGTSIAMNRGMVTEASQTIKEFVASTYVIVNLAGKDTTFTFNPLSRQYEEQISIPLGTTYNLFDSVNSSDWVGNPFSSDTADYYGGEVREAEINGTTFTDVDGQVLGDFNADGRLDSITWKNTNGGLAYFNVNLQKADGSYKTILSNVLADGVTAGTSLLDNSADFGGTDINELVFTNGSTKTVYKINGLWETNDYGDGNSLTVKKIATFESSFYAVLAANGGTENVNETFFSIGDGFRDMNDANQGDKFLLVGNFKVAKDGYDYYDYYIKRYNGNEFVDLTLEDGITPFKGTGNKIGFTKVGTSDFAAFYVDKSTHYTKGLPDKTTLYQIHSNEVVPIVDNVTVNENNTTSSQDGTNNEGGSKLLLNSTFGFFGNNLDDVSSGYLGIKNTDFVSGNGFDRAKITYRNVDKAFNWTLNSSNDYSFTTYLEGALAVLRDFSVREGGDSNVYTRLTIPDGRAYTSNYNSPSNINYNYYGGEPFAIYGRSWNNSRYYVDLYYYNPSTTEFDYYFVFEDGKISDYTETTMLGKDFVNLPKDPHFREMLYNSTIEYDYTQYTSKDDNNKGLFPNHDTALVNQEELIKHKFTISDLYELNSFKNSADYVQFIDKFNFLSKYPVFMSDTLTDTYLYTNTNSLENYSVLDIKNNVGFTPSYGTVKYDNKLGSFIYKTKNSSTNYELLAYKPVKYTTSNVRFYDVPQLGNESTNFIRVGSLDTLSNNHKGLNLADTVTGEMGYQRYFNYLWDTNIGGDCTTHITDLTHVRLSSRVWGWYGDAIDCNANAVNGTNTKYSYEQSTKYFSFYPLQ